MSYLLPHLRSGWAVDQAILNEEERVVCLRFGHDHDVTCMQMDEILAGIAEDVKNFCAIYVVDVTEVKEEFCVSRWSCSGHRFLSPVTTLGRGNQYLISLKCTGDHADYFHIAITGNTNDSRLGFTGLDHAIFELREELRRDFVSCPYICNLIECSSQRASIRSEQC